VAFSTTLFTRHNPPSLTFSPFFTTLFYPPPIHTFVSILSTAFLSAGLYLSERGGCAFPQMELISVNRDPSKGSLNSMS
jgi:hypothetical protein